MAKKQTHLLWKAFNHYFSAKQYLICRGPEEQVGGTNFPYLSVRQYLRVPIKSILRPTFFTLSPWVVLNYLRLPEHIIFYLTLIEHLLAIYGNYVPEKFRSENAKTNILGLLCEIPCYLWVNLFSGPWIIKTVNTNTANF